MGSPKTQLAAQTAGDQHTGRTAERQARNRLLVAMQRAAGERSREGQLIMYTQTRQGTQSRAAYSRADRAERAEQSKAGQSRADLES